MHTYVYAYIKQWFSLLLLKIDSCLIQYTPTTVYPNSTHSSSSPPPFYPRSSEYILWLFFGVFCWMQQWWEQMYLCFLLPAIGTLFTLLDCLIQPSYESFCLVLLYLLLFYLAIISWGLMFSEGKGSRGEGR